MTYADTQLVPQLHAEIAEWRTNALTQQARIVELEEKNERLVQLRAEEAGIAHGRIVDLESSLRAQCRFSATLETQVEAHVKSTALIEGRNYNVAQVGRIIRSRERAHKRVRMLLENKRTLEQRLESTLADVRNANLVGQPNAEQEKVISRQRTQIDKLIKECDTAMGDANRAREESAMMERDMREMHARMVSQEPSVLEPNRRLVITLDWVPDSQYSRMRRPVQAALREYCETDYEGVQFSASNGVTLTFNAWPSVTQEEAAEREQVATKAVQDHEAQAAAWAQAENERYKAGAVPAAAPADTRNADELLMSIGKDEPVYHKPESYGVLTEEATQEPPPGLFGGAIRSMLEDAVRTGKGMLVQRITPQTFWGGLADAAPAPQPDYPELTRPVIMCDQAVIEDMLGRLERLETHANGVDERIEAQSKVLRSTGESVRTMGREVLAMRGDAK